MFYIYIDKLNPFWVNSIFDKFNKKINLKFSFCHIKVDYKISIRINFIIIYESKKSKY
jgi:hypothetical protein